MDGVLRQAVRVGTRMLACALVFAVLNVQAEEVEAKDAAKTDPAATSTPAADETSGDAAKPDDSKVRVKGTFESNASLDRANGESDFDLDQYLRLRMTFPSHPNLRLNAGLWMSEDLDSDEDRDSVLRGIDDAYGADVRARLLELNVQFDNVFGNSTVKIGRQRILEGVAYNRIDGLYIKQFHPAWDWYAFAGVRASLYEDTHNDATVGGGISWQFHDRTRFAVDAYYAEDDHDNGEVTHRGPIASWLGWWYPRDIDEELDDTVVAFSVWHTLTENTRLFGQFSMFDGDGDELTLNVTGLVPKWDLTYDVGYKRRISRADDRVDDFTSFYRILGSYEEYDDFLISVYKPLSRKLTLSLQTQVHNSHEENPYTGNWDFERYSLTLAATEICKGTNASVSLGYWDADNEEHWVVTGEATKKWQRFELTVGAGYEAYEDEFIEYNPIPLYSHLLLQDVLPGFFGGTSPLVRFLDEESVSKRSDIHSIYSKFKWIVKDNQDVTARVSYEEDDSGESPYWRMRLGYAIRF
jgi:hypothetical protein